LQRIAFKKDGRNADIVDQILDCKTAAWPQAEQIARNFQRETPRATAYAVWKYAKERFRYKRDGLKRQRIRTPRAFFREGKGDCKSFAVFVASILKALGWKVYFKFTAPPGQHQPGHVYVIARKGKKRYILDPTIERFNVEAPFAKQKIKEWK